jgi:hypothetical protein
MGLTDRNSNLYTLIKQSFFARVDSTILEFLDGFHLGFKTFEAPGTRAIERGKSNAFHQIQIVGQLSRVDGRDNSLLIKCANGHEFQIDGIHGFRLKSLNQTMESKDLDIIHPLDLDNVVARNRFELGGFEDVIGRERKKFVKNGSFSNSQFLITFYPDGKLGMSGAQLFDPRSTIKAKPTGHEALAVFNRFDVLADANVFKTCGMSCAFNNNRRFAEA